MKYLIGNHYFGGLTGSELWTYELGRVLLARRHDVEYFGVEFTDDHNPTQWDGARIFRAGVMPNPTTPDMIVVGQYTTVAHLARIFPTTPIVQVLHGITDGLDTPAPDLPNLVGYVAVSAELYHLMRERGIPVSMITHSSQLIDDHIFEPHCETNKPLRHVLLISRRMDPRRRSIVEQASKLCGASCLWIPGTTGELSPSRLAERIYDADVVVGMGRAILEALMCQRAAIVYDIHGGDGLVTESNFSMLAFHNFSGRCNSRDYTPAELCVHLNDAPHEYLENLASMAEKHAGASWIVAQLDLVFQSLAWNWNHYPDRIARSKQRPTVAEVTP